MEKETAALQEKIIWFKLTAILQRLASIMDTYDCDKCEYTAASRKGLYLHKQTKHEGEGLYTFTTLIPMILFLNQGPFCSIKLSI